MYDPAPVDGFRSERLEKENADLQARLNDLRLRMREPEEIVRAIRDGEVDAFVVTQPGGERIYSLRAGDLLYRAMIEDMKDGAAAVDPSGLIVYCNASFAQLMKGEATSIIGTRIFGFAPVESRSFFDALREPAGEGTRRQELTLRASDGALVPVQATINRIHLEGDSIFCLVVTNLTDQKRQEQLLVESRRKDEFLAMLAHELRNPLVPIRYAAESLRSADMDPARVAWARDVINRQVTQLTHLVDDLLDVSRITRGKVNLHKEPLEIAGVVGCALEIARPLIKARGQELTVSSFDTGLRVEADATRLAQVISNLLNNASKFTPDGGRIWLEVERHGASVHVIVRDSGVGIAPELLPEIFNLFTQADASQRRSQGGLGIGLTLVRSLVEMHGGTVEGTSEGLNRGSQFLVRLPLLAEALPQTDISPRRDLPAPAALPTHKILVVDDNLDVAESFSQWLASCGHDVRAVHSGELALTEALAFRPTIMFVDVGLPGMDGYETARRLRAMPELEGVLLIAATGYGRDEDRQLSLDAGFDQHWVKPFAPEMLADFLAEVQGGTLSSRRTEAPPDAALHRSSKGGAKGRTGPYRRSRSRPA
jgi:PAS domain S-box-containing protein